MSKSPVKDNSSPLIQSENLPYTGITTRVMSTRRLTQLKETADRSPRTSIERPRFLSGSSIPNSTIRLHLMSPEAPEPTEHSNPVPTVSDLSLPKSIENKNVISSEERGLERMRQKIRASSTNPVSVDQNRERKRSSVKPLEMTISQNKRRRSTLESIKDAIDKSPNHVTKLVNADSIERRNIGQHFKILTSNWTPEAKDVNRFDSILNQQIRKEDLQTQTSFLISNLAPIS